MSAYGLMETKGHDVLEKTARTTFRGDLFEFILISELNLTSTLR